MCTKALRLLFIGVVGCTSISLVDIRHISVEFMESDSLSRSVRAYGARPSPRAGEPHRPRAADRREAGGGTKNTARRGHPR